MINGAHRAHEHTFAASQHIERQARRLVAYDHEPRRSQAPEEATASEESNMTVVEDATLVVVKEA